MEEFLCKIGFHKWPYKWDIIYDFKKSHTGWYYKKCRRFGCSKGKCEFKGPGPIIEQERRHNYFPPAFDVEKYYEDD